MAEEFYAAAAGIHGGSWLCSPRSSMFPGVGVFSPCFLDVPKFHWPSDSVKPGRNHHYGYSGSNDSGFSACGSGFVATDVENGFSPSAFSDLNRTLFDHSKIFMDINSYASILNEFSREDSDLYIGGGMSAGNFNNQNQVATPSEDYSLKPDRLSQPSVPKSRSSSKPSAINKLRPSNETSVWDSKVYSSARQPQNRPDCPIIGTKIQRNMGAYNTRDVKSTTKRSTNVVESAGPKRPRIETPSPLPTFKVRKEKLGDRITALQQLVSPFGKTDTASVLHEAIEYIKLLHDQVHVLSTPHMKNGGHLVRPQKLELGSRGLCLVPISSTFLVAGETPVDFWTPNLGGTFM